MNNIEKNNNFIEEREVVADVRRSGPRLSRRFLKRVLSLLLALYLLVNSCAFASDDVFPAATSSSETAHVDETPEEIDDMSLGEDGFADEEVDPNTYIYMLGETETELSLAELVKLLRMPFRMEDIQALSVLGSEEDLVADLSEPLTVVTVEGDYLIHVNRFFAEAGVAIYTIDDMYTLKLRNVLADGSVDLPVEEQGELELGDDGAGTDLGSDAHYSYNMANAQGGVRLSDILKAVNLPLQTAVHRADGRRLHHHRTGGLQRAGAGDLRRGGHPCRYPAGRPGGGTHRGADRGADRGSRRGTH